MQLEAIEAETFRLEQCNEPVGAAPWRRGAGLVDWWAMQQFGADTFVTLAQSLEKLGHMMALVYRTDNRAPGTAKNDPLSEANRQSYAAFLANVLPLCESIELRFSSVAITNLIAKLNGVPTPTYLDLSYWLRDLNDRIRDEMAQEMFFHVPPSRAKYWAQAQPLGLPAAAAFPSAQFDGVEAGNCFAAARYTACVFHLMRVLEIGLRAVAAHFGVAVTDQNWGMIIDQVEKAINSIGLKSDKPAGWRNDQEYFSQSVSHLNVVKNAWRNHVTHVRGKYTDEEAEAIYRSTRMFMDKLAEKLIEDGVARAADAGG